MECEIRKARYLSEIRTVGELREARRELEIREWFAKERLIEDTYNTFTLDNLLSIVAPPGSLVDRIIGGVGTGFTAIQGIMGVIGSFLGRRSTHGRTVAARSVHHHGSGHAAHVAHATKGHTSTHRPATRKRTAEIEVEVELEPKRPVRSRSKS